MKKGTKPARVARQTPGITGQIEISQVMAFYTEAASSGRVLIDQEDYVPTWIDDADRCEEAALLRARATEIVTKPGLGRCMVESCAGALHAGPTDVPAGGPPPLRPLNCTAGHVADRP